MRNYNNFFFISSFGSFMKCLQPPLQRNIGS
jgi:hypothetical protein